MKAVITLDESNFAKVEVDSNGMKRSLHLNMQELVNYIVNSVKDESVVVEEKVEVVTASPALPANTMKYAKLSDGTDLIFLFHPETKVNVTYHNDQFKDVPFPNLVFCFGLRNNRLVKQHVLAYKDRFLRDDTVLYRFPFSNVYNSGELCYYNNDLFSDLVQLQTLPYIWSQQPFNDHLYDQGKTNTLDKPLREIFESTQGQSFDYSMLVHSNKSFEGWAEQLLR